MNPTHDNRKIGSSDTLDQNMMVLFRWVLASRPPMGEKNIYGITYSPEASITTNSLFF